MFKFSGIPLFQAILFLYLILGMVLSTLYYPKNIAIKMYGMYLLTSVPSLFVALYYEEQQALLTFVYSLIPYILYLVINNKIYKNQYVKLLYVMQITILCIVLVGWAIRLEILPTNIFYDVSMIQFDFGYWGIRYLSSSRNSDYVYPMVGLALSLYFFFIVKKPLVNFLLSLMYIITLMASFSRAALVIALLSFVALFLTIVRMKLYSYFVMVMVFSSYALSFIDTSKLDEYALISASIFKLSNIDARFSNEQRIAIVESALISSPKYPLGVGLERYRVIYDNELKREYMPSYSGENAYITILIERGIIPFIFFILFQYHLFKSISFKGDFSLATFLFPMYLFYILFNYELNSAFFSFIMFFIIPFHFRKSHYRQQKRLKKIDKNAIGINEYSATRVRL